MRTILAFMLLALPGKLDRFGLLSFARRQPLFRSPSLLDGKSPSESIPCMDDRPETAISADEKAR